MYIDNKNYLDDIQAKLLNYSVSGSTISNDYFKGRKSSQLLLMDTEIGVKQLTVILDFTGKTRDHVEWARSFLVSRLIGKHEILMPDGFYYTSILSEAGEPEVISENIQTLTLVFDCVQHKELTKVQLTASGSVFVDGTVKTDCCFEIISTSTKTNFKINGITISKLTANRPFVIDGMTKRVLENGGNAFDKTDLIEFPKLEPGNNVITMSSNANLTVTYIPVFI